MKRAISIAAALGLILLTILAACAPSSAPTPVPAASTPAQGIVPASNVPLPTSQNPAWDKIVEAAKKEGNLTIYSYSFVGDIGIAMSRAFKDRYGISVDIVTGRGAEFLERVKTEKRIGGLVADMTEGSALHLKNMKKEGLTINVSGELPAFLDKDLWVANIFGIDPQDKHVIAFNFTLYTPFVNSNLVKPGEEPKVWKDFLDPKWKGKIIATDPLTSGGLYQLFVPLMREKVIDDEFLKALNKQDLRYSSALPDEGGILARGERHISLRGVDSVYARFAAEGAPIRAIAINDGTVLSVLTTAAYAGAPHPNAAKVFINWFLSPEGQTIFGKNATVASVRKDVPNFLPLQARITPTRPILLTNEDNDQATQFFRDRYLEKLWGR